MLTTTLQLRLSPDPQSQTHALLIPGEAAQSWLEEISSWPIEHGELKLIAVPKSKQDLSPRGVLVFGSGIADAIEFASPHVVQFACRATRLFLPVDGQLNPQVDDRFLRESFPPDSYCVWHPVGGLTTVSEEEAFGVADLIGVGSSELLTFAAADSGVALNPRLYSLTLLQPPEMSVEQLLDEGKGDIGDNASDLSKLKPTSNESELSRSAGAMDMLKRPVARFLKTLTSMVPGGASQRTWIDGVEEWADKFLGGMSEKQKRRQFLDVYRLQEMLEKNPDEGLKFAMPLSNLISSGAESANSRLSRSLVNFNLSNLGGNARPGGPSLPADLHGQLMRRYRELAEREIRLGRYRRAAYIYGNLLYDLSSAAKTLEMGMHYREAAILFKEKLNRIDDAARCLKEGGFFSEAIELFESRGQHEAAGDLYAELGLTDSAEESWRTAAEQLRRSGNLIAAAQLEEVKLGDHEQALETLASGWPLSRQSVLCLTNTFRILGNKGQHQRARTWIAKVESEAGSSNSFSNVVELISQTATKYPDQSTRAFAVDATYRMVSSVMALQSGRNSALLKSIAQLHPSDQLLQRDCNRYNPKRKTAVSNVTTSVKTGLKELALIARHELSSHRQWEAATGLRGGFLVVGRCEKKLLLNRISADFSEQTEYASASSDSQAMDNIILATNCTRELGLVHAVFDTRFKSQLFAASNCFPDGTMIQHLNLESNVIAICEGPHSQWQMLRRLNGLLLLECIDNTGALVSSSHFSGYEEQSSVEEKLPPFHCDQHDAYIGVGEFVVQVGAQGERFIPMEDSVEAIAGSVRGVAGRIAVSLKNGFRIVWTDSEMEVTQRVSEDMPSPKLLFTRTGHLIVVSDNRCEVYLTRRKELRLVCRAAIPRCHSLFRMDDSSQFGILAQSGQLMVYQIPLK